MDFHYFRFAVFAFFFLSWVLLFSSSSDIHEWLLCNKQSGTIHNFFSYYSFDILFICWENFFIILSLDPQWKQKTHTHVVNPSCSAWINFKTKEPCLVLEYRDKWTNERIKRSSTTSNGIQCTKWLRCFFFSILYSICVRTHVRNRGNSIYYYSNRH